MAVSAHSTTASRRIFLGGIAAFAPAVAVPTIALADQIGPDLVAAIQAFRDTDAARDRAENQTGEAYERFREMGGYPERPAALVYREDEDRALNLNGYAGYVGDDDVMTFKKGGIANLRDEPRRKRTETTRLGTLEDGFTQEEVESEYNRILVVRHEPWPEAQARADEIVAAWDAWLAESRRREVESGWTPAEAAEAAASAEAAKAYRTLAETPATTLMEIKAKADVLVTMYDGAATFFEAFVTDVETGDDRLLGSIVHDLVLLGQERPHAI